MAEKRAYRANFKIAENFKMADGGVVRVVSSRRRKNRRDVMNVMLAICSSNLNSERKFWVEPSRGGFFWERTVSQWTDDKLWVENFRMARRTFEFICEQLRPIIQKIIQE